MKSHKEMVRGKEERRGARERETHTQMEGGRGI